MMPVAGSKRENVKMTFFGSMTALITPTLVMQLAAEVEQLASVDIPSLSQERAMALRARLLEMQQDVTRLLLELEEQLGPLPHA